MWVFEGKEVNCIDDLAVDCVEIVYEITYESGKKYIGKKIIRSFQKKKPTKAMLAIRKNYVRKELVISNFIDYEGSSELTKNEVIVSKEILYQCNNKRTSTYLETALLFHYDVLFDDNFLNQNIGGVYYDNALDGVINVSERGY